MFKNMTKLKQITVTHKLLAYNLSCNLKAVGI